MHGYISLTFEMPWPLVPTDPEAVLSCLWAAIGAMAVTHLNIDDTG